jgi:hypothetical protein
MKTVHGPSILKGVDYHHIFDAKYLKYCSFKRYMLLNFNYFLRMNVDKDNKHCLNIFLTQFIEFWIFKFAKTEVNLKQLGPGFTLILLKSSVGSVMVLHTTTPIGPMIQKLSSYFYGSRHLTWFVKFYMIGESIQVKRFLRKLHDEYSNFVARF